MREWVIPAVGVAMSPLPVLDQFTAFAVAEIAIGLVFLAVATRLAFRRPPERSETPSWLDALDRSGPLRAAGLALVLSSGNPKNLALMLTAALAIVQDGQLAFGTAGFVALAVSTVSLLFAGLHRFLEPSQAYVIEAPRRRRAKRPQARDPGGARRRRFLPRRRHQQPLDRDFSPSA